jgi:hypothetical protein
MTARAAQIGADGVYDNLRPLRHLDGFFPRHMALVVVAVTQQNDCPAHRPRCFGLQLTRHEPKYQLRASARHAECNFGSR